MTIGIGYFLGGLALLLYALLCVYVGYKKPAKLFKITKLKLGKNKSDETIAKICYVWALIVAVISIVIFVLGYMNA